MLETIVIVSLIISIFNICIAIINITMPIYGECPKWRKVIWKYETRFIKLFGLWKGESEDW